MDELNELILSPFKELIVMGKTTMKNAEGSEEMLKMGKSLFKEGERAVSRLEPAYTQKFAEYNSTFLEYIRNHSELLDWRSELIGLLWGFEDYTDADGFEAEKFTELSKYARQVALKIHNDLFRLQLEAPAKSDSLGIHMPSEMQPPLSPPTSPPSDGVKTLPPVDIHPPPKELRRGETPTTVTNGPYPEAFYHEVETDQITKIPVPGEPMRLPPSPPATNPWTPSASPQSRNSTQEENGNQPSRPRYAVKEVEESLVGPSTARTANRNHHPIHDASRPRISRSYGDRRESISSKGHTSRPASQPTTSEMVSSIRKIHVSSPPTTMKESPFSPQDITGQQTFPPTPQDYPRETPGFENSSDELELLLNRQRMDQGLIPLESENPYFGRVSEDQSRHHTISHDSSFYQLKGFCTGAKKALNGETALKRASRPTGHLSVYPAARCTSCLFELKYQDVDNDSQMRSSGTFAKSGVSFRVRFLHKSHLAAKHDDEIMYGCLFCIQEGKTLEESDATVFFTSGALMTHISRHPRPLPSISGLTIVEEPTVPPDCRNNFDLHLPKPAAIHPVREHLAEIRARPTGVLKELVRRCPDQRRSIDEKPALEAAIGARLVGITWPAQHHGEWMLCWHDGILGSIPSKYVKLCPPGAREIKMGGVSQLRAKSRWKFSPKDTGRDWLKFDKNETITNISWQYSDQWFWSGSNAKGKWGIFPQDFIEPNSIYEPELRNTIDRRTSSLNVIQNQSGIFSRFGSKRPSSQRSDSIAETVSSKGSRYVDLE